MGSFLLLFVVLIVRRQEECIMDVYGGVVGADVLMMLLLAVDNVSKVVNSCNRLIVFKVQ